MKLIFLLSKMDLELAKEEVLALTDNTKHYMIENLLILDTNIKGLEQRLAYTHRIYRFLFECSYTKIIERMKAFDWQPIYTNNFCLRIHHLATRNSIYHPNSAEKVMLADKNARNKNNMDNSLNVFSEKELAGYIWRKVKKPKVDLSNPTTPIELFFFKNKVVCGLLIAEIKKDFNERRSHLKPGFSPVSLHPRLARALINLTGVQQTETVLDPLCGTGGILLEAGLMGIQTTGSDIDDEMLSKAKQNIRFYNLKNVTLLKQDATKLTKKQDYIVTDLPYGKNTKKIDILKLYKEFLTTLKKIMVKKAVVVFPYFVSYKKLIKNLKIDKEFSYYIHRSLSKKIVVLKP